MTAALSLPRRLLYSLLVAVGALLFVEVVARRVEAAWPAPRGVPLPSPQGGGCAGCVEGASAHGAAADHLPVLLVWSDELGTWVAAADDAKFGVAPPALRGPTPAAEKGPDEWRLMTLGDSSIWGDGVAEADVFSAVASRALSARTGRAVQAFNAAQPGHSTKSSLAVFDALGPRIQPDAVVIGNLWSDLFHRASPAFFTPPGQSSPVALYRLSLRLLAPWLPQRQVGWVDVERGLGVPAKGLEPDTPPSLYHENLTALAEGAAALGARPVFVLLPAPIDQQPGGAPAFIEAYRDIMRAVSAQQGAVLVDGVAGFAAAGAGPEHFFDSVHPSEAGHALLGALVADALAPSIEGDAPPAPPSPR